MPTPRYPLSASCTVSLEEGDITTVQVDAIVNAANSRLLGGGGVDGAIHRAAGPQLLEACRRLPELKPGIRCPTGEARLTPAFALPSQFVIHAVGPKYTSSCESAPRLIATFRSVLEIANQQGLKSLAFPAISCGVYGYPPQEAARIALQTCQTCFGELTDIRFVLFGMASLRVWQSIAEELFSSRLEPPNYREAGSNRDE